MSAEARCRSEEAPAMVLTELAAPTKSSATLLAKLAALTKSSATVTSFAAVISSAAPLPSVWLPTNGRRLCQGRPC